MLQEQKAKHIFDLLEIEMLFFKKTPKKTKKQPGCSALFSNPSVLAKRGRDKCLSGNIRSMIPLAVPSHMALFFHFSVRRSVKEGERLGLGGTKV